MFYLDKTGLAYLWGNIKSALDKKLDSDNYKSILPTSDSNSAAALSSTDTNYPTVRDIYYGLPNINGSHTYTSSTNIYAPTTRGNSGYELISNDSGVPIWKAPSYATCSTAATTVAKTAGITNFKLVTGATVKIKFTYSHTSSSAATLNVNNTGAKTIVRHNNTSNITVTSANGSWRAGEIVEFVYDGSYWVTVSSDQGFVEALSAWMQDALDNKLGSDNASNLYYFSQYLEQTYIDEFTLHGTLNADYGLYSEGCAVATIEDLPPTSSSSTPYSTGRTWIDGNTIYRVDFSAKINGAKYTYGKVALSAINSALSDIIIVNSDVTTRNGGTASIYGDLGDYNISFEPTSDYIECAGFVEYIKTTTMTYTVTLS